MFKIGLLQFNPKFGRPGKNLKRILLLLKDSTADLIVMPELAFTGYYFRDRTELIELAEYAVESEITKQLADFCGEKNCHVVAGFAEKDGGKYYNSAVLIGPSGLEYTYRKIHLFNDEKDWFDAGTREIEIQKIKGVKIGIMICWDWIFPEMARTLALKGAEIICHPSNLVLDLCQRTMIGRSIENGVFTITANRIGSDKRAHGTCKFTGRSQIVDPKGNLLFSAGAAREVYVEKSIDPAMARNKYRTARNHVFLDRRPEFYQTITGG